MRLLRSELTPDQIKSDRWDRLADLLRTNKGKLGDLGGGNHFLDATTSVRRYLLTYRGGGHAIGLNSAPDSMRSNLWDFSWFEDPVWRKDRIIAINLHMITAFLDRYVRDDESRAAYLDVAVPDSNAGVWPAEDAGRFDTISPGTGSITVWKGFQRNFSTNLELLRKDPEPSR